MKKKGKPRGSKKLSRTQINLKTLSEMYKKKNSIDTEPNSENDIEAHITCYKKVIGNTVIFTDFEVEDSDISTFKME